MPTALHKGMHVQNRGSEARSCAQRRRPLYYVSPTRRVGRTALRHTALRAATVEAEEVLSSQAEEGSTSDAVPGGAAEHSAAPPASHPGSAC